MDRVEKLMVTFAAELGVDVSKSSPIKDYDRIKITDVEPHSQNRQSTQREAVALTVMAKCQKVAAAPGVELARFFPVEAIGGETGQRGCLEDGCAADILKASLAEKVPGKIPAQIKFVLTTLGVEAINSLDSQAQFHPPA